MATETVPTLAHVLRHLAYRDKSNAAMHLGEVRFSPITFAVAEALDEALDAPMGEVFPLSFADSELLAEVLDHRAKYLDEVMREAKHKDLGRER